MSKTTTIEQEAAATLKRLEAKDPGLRQLLKEAYGYAVFPVVGKAALVVGGAYGKGAVFERGKFAGYATIGQTTVGVQIGGDTFTELIVFEDREAFEKLKRGKLSFAADASAVLVKAGAAAAKGFGKGTRAFVYGEGGMLLEAAIGGQKFKFKPAGQQEEDEESDERSARGSARNGRGQGAARGRQRGSARGQKESDESDEQDEQGEQEDEDQEQPGVLGKAADMVKEHPVATTVIGVAALAATAWVVSRWMGSSSEESGSDEDDDQQDESDDEGDDGAEDRYEDDQEDEQEDQRGGSRYAGSGRGARD